MKKKTVIEAWRNSDAYLSLSAEERAQLPAHPAGVVDVAEEELLTALGGNAGTHYSHCEPTASWCEDCGPGGGEIIFR